jgi:hypothetical protein
MALPYWRQKQLREREAAREHEAAERLGDLFGLNEDHDPPNTSAVRDAADRLARENDQLMRPERYGWKRKR